MFVVGALVLSGFILVNTFEDLDYQAIIDSVSSLEDADFIALIAMWVIWVTCQGLLTGALVKGLPVRRGVVAYLGPAGVTSVLPGPSDLPFRHKMFTTWGYSPTEATLAVAAGGVFSIGIKLVLPVVAAIGLIVSNTPIDGTLRTIVVIAVLVGVGVLGVAYVFGAERRTAWMGRMLTAVWAFVLRLLRKPDPPDLAEKMIDARAESIERLRDRWIIGTWATVITAGARFALLLMSLRFTGTPDVGDQLATGVRRVRGRPGPHRVADHGRRRRRQRGRLHRPADRGGRLAVRQPDHRRGAHLPGAHVGHHHPDRSRHAGGLAAGHRPRRQGRGGRPGQRGAIVGLTETCRDRRRR